MRHSEALSDQFEDTTLGQLYDKRKIALAITAIEMSQHRSWIFKTPHLSGSNDRDSRYTLVDVCMASTSCRFTVLWPQLTIRTGAKLPDTTFS